MTKADETRRRLSPKQALAVDLVAAGATDVQAAKVVGELRGDALEASDGEIVRHGKSMNFGVVPVWLRCVLEWFWDSFGTV
jgi:hypothetical protein